MLRIYCSCLFVILVCAAVIPAQKISSAKIPSNSCWEKKVIEELNLARTGTDEYSKHVQSYLEVLRNNILYLPNRIPTRLSEGKTVIVEAVDFLKSSENSTPLTISEPLSQVAKSQLSDLLEDPKLGHYGKDGADLGTRLKRFGKLNGPASENIVYGESNARQAVITMLIDNGVKSRLHRLNILNPNYLIVGIGCGKTEKALPICVLVFAKDISTKRPEAQLID